MQVIDELNENFPQGSQLDRIGNTESLAWVIDGADALEPNSIDLNPAQWLVDNFSDSLMQHEASSLSRILKDAQTVLEKNPVALEISSFSPQQKPCFTLALARQLEENVELGVIGDASIVLLNDDGDISLFSDERITPFSERTRLCTTVEEKHIQMRRNRKDMNMAKGYWAGTSGNEWLSEVKYFHFLACNCKRVLLCSDGFLRAKKFGLIEWEDILLQRYSLYDIYQKLRQFESRYQPKEVKKHDDVSALLLTFLISLVSRANLRNNSRIFLHGELLKSSENVAEIGCCSRYPIEQLMGLLQMNR